MAHRSFRPDAENEIAALPPVRVNVWVSAAGVGAVAGTVVDVVVTVGAGAASGTEEVAGTLVVLDWEAFAVVELPDPDSCPADAGWLVVVVESVVSID